MASRLKAPQRREQLMAVATKLFARHGFEATTTAAIAEAAGVSEPILYRHFKGKQDLFVAIVRSVSEQTLGHWRQVIAAVDSPDDQLRAIAEEFPAHVNKLADAYRVIHGALNASQDRKVVAVLKEHYTQIEEFFASVIENGQAAGIFRKDIAARVAAWRLIMTGIGYAMITLNLPQLDDHISRDATALILRGLRA